MVTGVGWAGAEDGIEDVGRGRGDGTGWGATCADDTGRGTASEGAARRDGTGVGARGEGMFEAGVRAGTVEEITEGVLAVDREVEALGNPPLSFSKRVTSAKSLLVISAPVLNPCTRSARSNAVFASEYSSRAL